MNVVIASQAVQFLRQYNPRAHVIMGGPLIENLHHHLADENFRLILEELGADTYVLEREGEGTLTKLVWQLREGGSARKIKNCYTRYNSQFVFTGQEREANDLNAQAIDWSLFAHRRLGPTVQTRTALGCPFRCTFCDYPVRAGRYETADLSVVEHELRQIAARGDVHNLVLIDDTFNVPIGRFKDILRMMIRNGFDFEWYSYFRCNLADAEVCDLMRRSRCAGVFLGIESGDPSVLKNMKKMAQPEQYRRGIQYLNDAGIPSFASLIVGFPGETSETVANTIELIDESRPTFFRGEIWYYNQRSPIHDQAALFGIEGNGYAWKHATMDWVEGCEAVTRLFRGVTNSTWLPMYDMDFWIIPYLRGHGMSLDDIVCFLRRCNRVLACETGLTRHAESEDLPAALHELTQFSMQNEIRPQAAAQESA